MSVLLIEQIKNAMSAEGIDRCHVIINGMFWAHHGKVVTVQLDVADRTKLIELRVFTGTLKEPKYFEDAEDKLRSQMDMSIDLTGLEFLQDPNYVDCSVVQGEGIVVLKSRVYALMEESLNLDAEHSLMVQGHGQLNDAELTKLRNLAMKWLYAAFGDTMYKHYKPITAFAKYNKFYKLFRLYVPVLIRTPFMPNPLMYEPRFLNSELYQMTLEKGRKILTPSGIECYFLTELEVCRALHLKNFTRLTPTLYYKILVGSLRPDVPGFPRVARSDMDIRYVRDAGIYTDSFRNEYTLEQYAALLQQYQNSYTDLETLRTFRKVDSLFTVCAKEARILRRYGGYVLDTASDPITTGSLYKILQEVRV